jgi:hypothetical protein
MQRCFAIDIDPPTSNLVAIVGLIFNLKALRQVFAVTSVWIEATIVLGEQRVRHFLRE